MDRQVIGRRNYQVVVVEGFFLFSAFAFVGVIGLLPGAVLTQRSPVGSGLALLFLLLACPFSVLSRHLLLKRPPLLGGLGRKRRAFGFLFPVQEFERDRCALDVFQLLPALCLDLYRVVDAFELGGLLLQRVGQFAYGCIDVQLQGRQSLDQAFCGIR